MKETEWVWMNGLFVPWSEAKIHVLSHVVHYGSSDFEGIRCYEKQDGTAHVLHLSEHIERLFDSAIITRMPIRYSKEELRQAVIDTIVKNGIKECYIRPIVYRGYGELGVDPTSCPVDVAIAVLQWGRYLSEDALEKGVGVGISYRPRNAPNATPTLAKTGAGYLNAQLIKMEAKDRGYAEAIALNSSGFVSEGSGENVFLVRNCIIKTPPLYDSVLPGIVRSSVIRLASDMGYEVREDHIMLDELFIADELFFTGTAVEISPIVEVEKRMIGAGTPGPITGSLQKRYFGIIRGNEEDTYHWLTPVSFTR